MLAFLLAVVTHSIVGHLDKPLEISEEQINIEMREQMCCVHPLRVMSFNMLFDCCDKRLDEENRWPYRKARVVEYLLHAKPDVIGTQELQKNQREDLMDALGGSYDYFGKEEAIFYRKERLELICGEMTGCITTAVFNDRKGGSFTLMNTHLAFGKVEKRLAQAKQLAKMASATKGPLIVTGDMNTFPFRPELTLPFYDGDYIMQVIQSGGLDDARHCTLLGHYGPISSTNFSMKEMKCFCNEGEPGVILDHIFVNPEIDVRTHGIDPARVDGLFVSDHLPVIADVIPLPP